MRIAKIIIIVIYNIRKFDNEDGNNVGILLVVTLVARSLRSRGGGCVNGAIPTINAFFIQNFIYQYWGNTGTKSVR
jgi:hypothetical protein